MKNIHILPTDKPSRFALKSNEEFVLSNHLYSNSPNFTNYHIYITSDEEIKDGDWFIHSSHGTTTLLKCKSTNSKEIIDNEDKSCWLEYSNKIILTTDQDLINDGVQEIDDEFLEWFVKNPSCEEVVVEKKMLCDYCGEENCDNLRCRGYLDSVWYEIITPKEESKPILESLQEYFKNTTKEKVIEDWNEFQHLDEEGITVKEFLENQKQKTLEEVAEKYSENWEEITGLDYENTVPSEVNKLDFINGAKWQQEQNKNLYSEEDLLKFGAFVRIEDKKEKRLFLIQDYYKKWLEQSKKK